MRTPIQMLLLAAPLFTLIPAPSAQAQRPRKVVVVATPARAPAVVAPAPVAVAPAPAVVVHSPAPRVAVIAPEPVIAVAPPVVTVTAPVPQVTFSATPPVAAVQVQVTADSAYAATGPVPVTAVPVASVPVAPSCSLREEGELQAVIGAIKSESFSSDQLRVLGEAAHGSCFTVAQVEQIIPLFSFEADQLKALGIMAPRIVDRQNNFRIYGLFTFESGKQQARRILSR